MITEIRVIPTFIVDIGRDDMSESAMSESICVGEKASEEAILRVDFHTHILPKHLPDFAARYGYGGFISLDHDQGKVSVPGNAQIVKDGRSYKEVPPGLWDMTTRLDEMDRDGIDVQVVCTMPAMFSYWAKADDTADLARILNNDMAKEMSKHPKRFIGLGTLPMQAPELAVEELRRCVKDLGFAGVQIGSHINEWSLDAVELVPFWEAAEDLGACVFVHPWDMTVTKRDKKYMMPWLVGMPADTTQAIVSVVLGGVLEKFPKLKLCFAHGAGAFPYTAGRVQQGYDAVPGLCATDSSYPPDWYKGKFFADSLVHSVGAMKLLVSELGEDQVIFGTDYPFHLGETTGSAKGVFPGRTIESTESLSDDAKSKIYSGNALRFLGRDAKDYVLTNTR